LIFLKKIGLLSDTHSFLHERIFEFFSGCDEIWHAGDIGFIQTTEILQKFKPLRAVYGNIDGNDVRNSIPADLVFYSEKVKVFITHMGGYPGHYDPHAKEIIRKEKPGLFVCGHSHILKVMYDKDNSLLHINPGSAGKFGLQKSITMVRFVIDGKDIRDLEVLDIPRG
jgi:putative phosphoesterase